MKDYNEAFHKFFDDLEAGRLDHAYESTSARFKKQMSRSEFDSTVGRFLAVRHGSESTLIGAQSDTPLFGNKEMLDRNWCYRSRADKGPDGKVTEFTIWVLTDVNDDSFFYRRPPAPRVEEIQIQEFSEKEWDSGNVPDPMPSWEQQ